MPNPFAKIPARVRYWLYVAYSVVALVFGALQIASVKHVGPVVVGTVMQELAFLGLALGFTAASNVTTTNTATVEAPADVAILPTDGTEEPRGILGKAKPQR
jgi:hypothetical protein